MILYDLIDAKKIAELQPETASYGWIWNAPGALSLTLGVDQPEPVRKALAPYLQGIPQLGRLAVFVPRTNDDVSGEVWTGYILWTAEESFENRTLTLNGEGWLSCYRRRVLSADKSYTSEDIATIAADLIGWADSHPSGLATDVSDANDTATEVTVSYPGAERKFIGAIIEELFGNANRNFRFDTYWIDDAPVTKLYTDPHRNTGFVFEVGAHVVGGDVQVDGTAQATYAHATGSGEVAPVTMGGVRTDIPTLDVVVSDTDITTTTNLEYLADHALTAGMAPVVLPKLVLKPDAVPAYGLYRVGDKVRVRYSGGLTKVDQSFYIAEIQPSITSNGIVDIAVTLSNIEVPLRLRPEPGDKEKETAGKVGKVERGTSPLPSGGGGGGGGSFSDDDIEWSAGWSTIGTEGPMASKQGRIVTLRGVVGKDTPTVGPTTFIQDIATLPSGYWPEADMIFPVWSDDGTAHCSFVYVNTSDGVCFLLIGGYDQAVRLDGITFTTGS